MRYDYRCSKGHVTEDIRRMDDRDRLLSCPVCRTPATRIFSPWMGRIQWEGRFYGTGRYDELGPLGEGTGGGRR